jgi:hypothetical protein
MSDDTLILLIISLPYIIFTAIFLIMLPPLLITLYNEEKEWKKWCKENDMEHLL